MDDKKNKITGKKIGYARVSTTDQNLEGQLDALKKEGCTIFYHEKVSGAKNVSPSLKEIKHLSNSGLSFSGSLTTLTVA